MELKASFIPGMKDIRLNGDNIGSWGAERIFYRPITDPGSSESFSRIRQWITHCTSNHPRCRLDISGSYVPDCPKLPTRVLNVGDEARDVSLFISNGESARYVALSHCWGGASIIQTTMSLLEEFQQHIKYENLSKTIQDAVHVTRELGIRYLWVDSLCIYLDRTRIKYCRNLRFGRMVLRAFILRIETIHRF